MRNLRIAKLGISALALSAIFLEACGGSSNMSRQLLSVSISPASASAPGSPEGQVQFVATGHYNTEPYTVTPLEAVWGASASPEQIATITQKGLATCSRNASGTTTVEAWVQVSPAVCTVIDSAGRPGCGNVGASAKLKCP
jgi:hypothetical protein